VTNHRRKEEAKDEALLATLDENTAVNVRPCDFSKETQYWKLGNACGLHGIADSRLRYLPRRPLLHLIRLYKTVPSAWSFCGTLKGGKNHDSAETRQRHKISPEFTFDQPLVHYRQAI
jgi:hypothetical protein